MSNLWDKPPQGPNDYTQGPAYEAVGRACVAWELLETQFSVLLTALQGVTADELTLRQYGRSALSNVARLYHLEQAAERFFVANCSQSDEGEFADLIATARRMIVRRNQIAHASICGFHVVTGFDAANQPMRDVAWSITSPFHAVEPLQQDEGRYYFSSHAILEFANRFVILANQVGQISEQLRARTSSR